MALNVEALKKKRYLLNLFKHYKIKTFIWHTCKINYWKIKQNWVYAKKKYLSNSYHYFVCFFLS